MVVGFQVADVAQLAEQPPRKWQVVSSNLTVGSNQHFAHVMVGLKGFSVRYPPLPMSVS